MWSQPLDPLGSVVLSAVAATVPLVVLLVMMGVLRKSGALSAGSGLLTAALMALAIWHMPLRLAALSCALGTVYALWPILWIVFTALWLYNLSVDTGKFELLRAWMARHATNDPNIQVIVVAFCFGALLEGTAGFGAPVAVASFLLVRLGFQPRQAVKSALIANTAPVAFGALGTPVVALAAVTGLDLTKLSAMVGRQLPFVSFLLPFYLVLILAGRKGLGRAWPAAAVSGGSFAVTQFAVSNFWNPYAVDIIAALVSIVATVWFLRLWRPESSVAVVESAYPIVPISKSDAFAAWAPWVLLATVMVAWSYFKFFGVGQVALKVPYLHNGVFISLYHKPYAAIYPFQPLAAGSAGMVATILTAALFKTRPNVFLRSGFKTLRQLKMPGLTVCLTIALAYLYNYSGMAYTLGAALARVGFFFPVISGFLGWIACFLSGSDTAANLLFGNLQVAAGHKLGLNPVLLAATNSSGAVAGKIISPQNIAVGVTTVGLIGQEGDVLRSTFWPSMLMVLAVSLIAFAQAYWLKWMVP